MPASFKVKSPFNFVFVLFCSKSLFFRLDACLPSMGFNPLECEDTQKARTCCLEIGESKISQSFLVEGSDCREIQTLEDLVPQPQPPATTTTTTAERTPVTSSPYFNSWIFGGAGSSTPSPTRWETSTSRRPTSTMRIKENKKADSQNEGFLSSWRNLFGTKKTSSPSTTASPSTTTATASATSSSSTAGTTSTGTWIAELESTTTTPATTSTTTWGARTTASTASTTTTPRGNFCPETKSLKYENERLLNRLTTCYDYYAKHCELQSAAKTEKECGELMAAAKTETIVIEMTKIEAGLAGGLLGCLILLCLCMVVFCYYMWTRVCGCGESG